MPHPAVSYPFGDCRICDDKATGVHYGVATCEGCKGFFKRSIPKADKYRCFFGGQCTLNPRNRNRCKSCRFKRCLDMGMSIDAVRMGRIPKVDKQRALEMCSGGNAMDEKIPEQQRSHLIHGNQEQPSVDSTSQLMLNSPQQSAYHGAVCLPPLTSTSSSRQSLLDDTPTVLHSVDSGYSDSGSDVTPNRSVKKESVSPLVRVSPSLSVDIELANRPRVWEETSSCASTPVSPSCIRPRTSSQSTTQGPYSPDVIKQLINQLLESGQGQHLQQAIIKQFLRSPPSQEQSKEHVRFDNRCGSQSDKNKEDLVGLDRLQDAVKNHGLLRTDNVQPNQDLKNNLISPHTRTQPLSTSIMTKRPKLECTLDFSKDACNQLERGDEVRDRPLSLMQRPVECSSMVDQTHKQMGYSADPIFPSTEHLTALNDNVQQSYQQKAANYSNTYQVRMCQYDDSRNTGQLQTLVNPTGMGEVGLHKYGDNTNTDQLHRPITYTGIDGQGLPHSEQFRDLSQHLLNKADRSSAFSTAPVCTGTSLQRYYASASGAPIEVNKCAVNKHASGSASADYLDHDDLHASAFDPGEFDQYLPPKPDRTLTDIERGNIAAIDSDYPGIDFTQDAGHVLTAANQTAQFNANGLSLMEDTLQQIRNYHFKIFEDIDNKMRIMEDDIRGLVTVHPLNKIDRASRKQVAYVWDRLMESVPRSSALILDFCHGIPGFDKFNVGDQGTLIKASFFEIWLLSSAPLLRDGKWYLRFPSGMRYSRWWMRHFLPEELVEGMAKCAENLNLCRLNRIERVLLCAVLLINPERAGLEKVDDIRQLHEHYLDVLGHEVQRNHQTHHTRVLMNIFRILPLLEPLNQKQAEVIGQFKIDHPPDGCLKPYDVTDDVTDDSF